MTRVTRCLVLDLDDTLYLERDYVRSGFIQVGEHLRHQHGCPDFADRAWALFEQGHRNTVFDTVLRDCRLDGIVSVTDLVHEYRAHTPDIRLCADAERFLERVTDGRPMGMITDGPIASQSAKVAALGLAPQFDHIIMSDSFGIEHRKPDPLPFTRIEELLGGDPTEFTYIADNPVKDFLTPRRRGWHSIRIRRPLAEHAARPMEGDYAAHAVIESLDEISV